MKINNAQNISRFALFKFVLVLVSCIALSIRPEFGWLFLVAAFLPLSIRIIWKRSLFKSTHLNLLILLFSISSVVGVFVAYDWDLAIHKFLLILGSILIFFSLAYQPKENLWIIALILGIFGVTTTFIFILTNNWALFSADFKFVETYAEWFVKLGFQGENGSIQDNQTIHANIVAGINALFLPVNIISTLHFWKLRKKSLFIFSLFLCILLSIGLLLTSSRAAWVALLFGLVVFASLNISSIQNIFFNNKFLIFLIPTLILSTGIFAPIILTSINNHHVSISEITSFESRLQLAKQTTYLIADFPLTGGGLASFPGLYSHYILSIPFFMFGYSHNLYLDLMLEQGIFGFGLWVFIIISCFSTLRSIFQQKYHKGESTTFGSAIFSGLIIFLIHGMIDDPIYSSTWGLPMLFVLPGLTIALSDHDSVNLRNPASKPLFPILVVSVLVTTAFITFRNQILAAWYANIGAINMAKIELAEWPTNEWNKRSNLPVYNPAENLLMNSLSLQNDNLTANYRQGLIWMARHDFQKALPYLETALKKEPEHRGVQKNLGYCYTWLGKFEQAELILKHIPEAQTEMEVYEQLWQNQGRFNLADNAAYMKKRLSSN